MVEGQDEDLINDMADELCDKNKGIKIIEHDFNQGKGAALKTGLRYALLSNCQWIVTADADGQHLPDDILNVLKKGCTCGNDIVLGVRTFDKSTPLRSRFGNCLTKFFFRILYGGNIRDTQTGLRFIPRSHFEEMLSIPHNHYEFEFASLIKSIKNGNVQQIPIKTVYEPGNPTSHFNKFLDSARIYWVLARSVVVSTSTTIVDISFFMLFQQFIENTLACILASRTVATIFYFYLARSFVFKSRTEFLRQFLLFSLLVLANALILSPIVDFFYHRTEFAKGIIYIFLTMIFYFINLNIQRWIIFRDR
jgi:glycosyltransferase involved in cell wall biosynthesis